MRKLTNKRNWDAVNWYKKRFLQQPSFPSLPRQYESRMQPILYTGHLIFIRSKFLFIGMVESLEEKNEYTFYSLSKSFWENVAAFGYYYLKISDLLEKGLEEEAFNLAGKMGLGGRRYPTEEMVLKAGGKIEEYLLPNIYTMMDLVDKDLKKRSKVGGAILRDLYDEQIAEGGHTTYTGLTIATKWINGRLAQLPDINKKWANEDRASLINLAVLSATIFFVYWDKFEELKKKY